MPIKRKFILEPIKTKETDEMKTIREFRQSLKLMSNITIEKIYKDLDVTNFKLDITEIEPIGGRKIVKVSKGEIVYFYKSTGSSRTDAKTENYWFPCMGDCLYPVNPITGKSKERIRKLEDKYLDMDDSILTEQLKKNPDMLVYQRFITRENAMISKKLTEIEK